MTAKVSPLNITDAVASRLLEVAQERLHVLRASSDSIICRVSLASQRAPHWTPGHIETNCTLAIDGSERKLCLALSTTEIENGSIIQVWTPLTPNDLYYEPENAVTALSGFKPETPDNSPRASDRVGIRQNEGLRVSISNGETKWTGPIRDLSSFGFAVDLPQSQAKILRMAHPNISIEIGEEKHELTARQVWQQPIGSALTRVGYEFIQPTFNDRISNYHPISLQDGFGIPGIFLRKAFFFENAPFRIVSLSKDDAVLLIHSSELFLWNGMKIDLRLFVHSQTSDDCLIPTEVTHVLKHSLNRLFIRVKLPPLPGNTENDLISYLLHFCKVSPSDLRSAGFKFRKMADAFQIRSVETNEDYNEVLNLRHTAYLDAGKISEQKTVSEMSAPLDYKSRILTVRHHGKIIASAALSFPDSEDLVLDTEKPLPDGYPKSFPSKLKIVEISRLCTHPDYRGGDLLHRIFEHIYKIFVTSGREYILTSTDEKLWPLYKKLGFAKTGYRYNHPYLAGIPHDIILIKVDVGTAAKGINPLVWAYLYGEMTEHLEQQSKTQVPLLSRPKQWFGRVLCRLLLALR